MYLKLEKLQFFLLQFSLYMSIYINAHTFSTKKKSDKTTYVYIHAKFICTRFNFSWSIIYLFALWIYIGSKYILYHRHHFPLVIWFFFFLLLFLFYSFHNTCACTIKLFLLKYEKHLKLLVSIFLLIIAFSSHLIFA